MRVTRSFNTADLTENDVIPSGRVLVTGGTGFLGGWCVVRLLQRGCAVRTTVRDQRREADVRATVKAAGVDAGSRLEVVAADLASEAGWSEAAAGCRYVLHVASPFPAKQPKDPQAVIGPARDGALRVLGAALDADVERIVLTSSIAAVRESRTSSPERPYTEADWTDGDDTRLVPYVRSKALEERAAWELVADAGVTERLTTVCPGLIVGPTLNRDYSFSLQVIQRMLKGTPAAPRIGFPFVDACDLADLHLLAMTHPAAAGERFLGSDEEWVWAIDVARILRERLGAAASKAPTRVAPDFAVRFAALFDPALRIRVPELGKRYWISCEKARTVLGWTTRPVQDTIADTARSLL